MPAIMRIAAVISTVFFAAGCDRAAGPPPAPAQGPAEVIAAAAVGSHSLSGRTLTVVLPFRAVDGLEWTPATAAAKARPFVFRRRAIEAGRGPGGADLAIFTYEAEAPGSAVLEFGLVPEGRVLIGPPDRVFTGSIAGMYRVEATAD